MNNGIYNAPYQLHGADHSRPSTNNNPALLTNHYVALKRLLKTYQQKRMRLSITTWGLSCLLVVAGIVSWLSLIAVNGLKPNVQIALPAIWVCIGSGIFLFGQRQQRELRRRFERFKQRQQRA